MRGKSLVLAAYASFLFLGVGCSQSIDQERVDAAVATALSSGNAVAQRVQAQSFELVDGSGELRAIIGPTDEGTGFVLKDAEGVTRASLTLAENGVPSMTLLDANGARRIGMEFALDTSPAMFLRDAEGTLKGGFQVQEDGGPLLFFRSKAREDVFAVSLIGDDQPVMSMAEPDGVHRMFLGLGESKYSPNLIFLSGSGKPVMTLP